MPLGSVAGSRAAEETSYMTTQPSTSDTGITDALTGLQDLDELPTADHVARFNAVHDSLTAALSSIDEF
ncbi:MAG: hypothetical protein ACRDTZ_12045 [Pseudonocardiaceae bacterium]